MTFRIYKSVAREPLKQSDSNMALSFDNPFPVFPTKKKPTSRRNEASSPNQHRPPQMNYPGPGKIPLHARTGFDGNGSRTEMQRRPGSDPAVRAFAQNIPAQGSGGYDGIEHARPHTSGPTRHGNYSGASEGYWPAEQQPYPQRSQTMPPTVDAQQGAKNFSRNAPAQTLQGSEGYALPYRGRNMPQQPYNGQQMAQHDDNYSYAPADIYQDMSKNADIEEEMPNFADDHTPQNRHRRGYSDEQQQQQRPYQAARAPYRNPADDELYLPQSQSNSQNPYQEVGSGRQLNKSRSQPNIRGQANGRRARAVQEIAENVASMPSLPHAQRHIPYNENAYQASQRFSAESHEQPGSSPYRQNSGFLPSRELQANQGPRDYPQPATAYPYAEANYHGQEQHYHRAPPEYGLPQRSMTDQIPQPRQNFAPRPFRRTSQETTMSNKSSHTLPDLHTGPDTLPYNPLPSRATPPAQVLVHHKLLDVPQFVAFSLIHHPHL